MLIQEVALFIVSPEKQNGRVRKCILEILPLEEIISKTESQELLQMGKKQV